ncbi:ABC transporter permease [Endothiovibrio diazotrophicus]
MRSARLGLHSLRREWRAGELRVLALALVVAVAAITSVGFFTDRVRVGLERQAGELLAADLRVVGSAPPPEAWAAEGRRRGLAASSYVRFPSVVLAGERAQLVSAKAVAAGYPLRGELRSAATPFAAEEGGGAPAPGTVWAEARLFPLLGIAPGDSVKLGRATLRVARVLTYEPDRGGGFSELAPRLLFNAADLEATALIRPGSRVRYALLAAGEVQAVAGFRRWLKERLGPGMRIEGVRDARPELKSALERAERFLGLAAMVSVILAGVAVALAARRHAERHLDGAAVMRCLGAGQRQVLAIYLWQMVWLGLAACALGAAVGYGAQEGLVRLLGSLVPAGASGALPAPSPWPLLSALVTGMAALLGFALPPLLPLRRVPPARVLRRDLGPAPAGAWWVYGGAVTVLAVLMAWQAGEARLAVLVIGGVAVTLALLVAAAWLLVRALRPLRARVGVSWRWGLANIGRRAGGSVIQVAAFGLGIMALLLLGIVRVDLLEGWRASLPERAPNQFLINIQPDEVAGVARFIHDGGGPQPDFRPMIRGRLVRVNERAVGPDDYQNPRAQRLVAREFNLSWSAALYPGNRIAAGRWWSQGDSPGQFSVESGLAETLGIALGDRLRFRIAGREVEGRVTSLRDLEWGSFQVNFFVAAPPGLLEEYPATYITAFHLPPERRGLLAELVKRYPSVTVIDVEALMAQVRSIIERVSSALEYVFLFTLAAGLTVLYAAIQATSDERMRESALLRTLGADRRRLWGGMVAEFATLGLLAGTVAALAATAVGYGVSLSVFDLPYRPDPLLWLAGPLGGLVGVGAAGLLGVRRVVERPPLATLRR